MALTGIVATTTLAELLGMEVGDILSGGGEGIETEEGEFYNQYSGNEREITFTNEHDRAPDLFYFVVKGSVSATTGNSAGCVFYDFEKTIGVDNLPKVGNYTIAGVFANFYYSSGSKVNTVILGKKWSSASVTNNHPAYYSTPTGIKASSGSNGTFPANTTYVWKAFWLPIAEEQG